MAKTHRCRATQTSTRRDHSHCDRKKFVTETDLSRVIVDTTVQEKNITFPTDSKLLAKTIIKLAKHRGHDYKGDAVIRIAGSSNKGLSPSEIKRKRRRSAIEPVIGHLKSDHRLDRCYLKGRVGDALNLVGSAIGFNTRKLLRLLGLGIFSRALLACGVFCRFFRSPLAFSWKWAWDSQRIFVKLGM